MLHCLFLRRVEEYILRWYMNNWSVYQPLLDKSCKYFDVLFPLLMRSRGRDERQRKSCLCMLHIWMHNACTPYVKVRAGSEAFLSILFLWDRASTDAHHFARLDLTFIHCAISRVPFSVFDIKISTPFFTIELSGPAFLHCLMLGSQHFQLCLDFYISAGE